MTSTCIQKGIPRVYPILLTELQSVILNYASVLNLEAHVLETAHDIILDEVYNILISKHPDRNVPETQNFLYFLFNNAVSLENFVQFKSGLMSALNRYLVNIEQISQLWKEHADPYLTWRISDDGLMLMVMFTPVYPARNFDEILRREVDAAVKAGEFVPYKYLRVLGMC